jgi:hypothetical protein
MSTPTTRPLLKQLSQCLQPLLETERDRHYWLSAALADLPQLRSAIDWSGTPAEFTQHLVYTLLTQFGGAGREALLNLLDDIAEQRGVECATELREAVTAFGTSRAETWPGTLKDTASHHLTLSSLPTAMQPLNGLQLGRLNQALLTAFDTASLERLLRYRLDKRLDLISTAPDFTQVVFRVVQVAEMEGWTAQLVQAAKDARPDKPDIQAFALDWGLLRANTPVDTPSLERIIQASHGFLDVATWRERLARIEGAVCYIQVADRASGTGFLVGADRILTNYHVVKDLIPASPDVSGQIPADRVSVYFDYKRVAEDKPYAPGFAVGLAPQAGLLDWSPPSAGEFSGDEPPQADELDYALLRLAERVGERPVGGVKAEPDARPRGWIAMHENPPELLAGGPLFIVQHPDNQPMKLALETQAIIGVNANGTRVRYRTNTEPGSSGSPCFDANWNLVALHHAGDPNFAPGYSSQYNQGIPIRAIVKLLKQRGRFGVLEKG